jgi:hypothetical protein
MLTPLLSCASQPHPLGTPCMQALLNLPTNIGVTGAFTALPYAFSSLPLVQG